MNWYVCKSICACSRELLRRSSTLDDDDDDDDKDDVDVVDGNENERAVEDILFLVFESWLAKAMNLALVEPFIAVHVIWFNVVAEVTVVVVDEEGGAEDITCK